jgi:hypothetical protein
MAVDMSPAAIDERLQQLARLSVLTPPYPPAIDMGAVAVERRLREVAQLFALEFTLRALAGPR